VNLKEWTASQGISYATARRWFGAGKLPVPACQAGRLIVIGEPAPAAAAGLTVLYARVPPAEQTPDLDRQVARITGWVTSQCLPVDRVVTEAGSALNGARGKFLALLRDPSVSTIVVEHRDRFAGSGAGYVTAVMAASGRKLRVVDPAGVDEDLAGDVTEILTSVCARLYGRRAAGGRAARALAAIESSGA
jgi:predicted site-specific integrase-resolvase